MDPTPLHGGVRQSVDDEEEEEEQDLWARLRSKSHEAAPSPVVKGAVAEEPRSEGRDRALATAPTHIHSNEWKDMLSMSRLLTPPPPAYDPKSLVRTRSNTKSASWITQTFFKRECAEFVPTQKHINKCGCGRTVDQHHIGPALQTQTSRISETSDSGKPRWSIRNHTAPVPTDAFGTIQFENVGLQSEARYARLSFDTDPSLLLQLLQLSWRVKTPKLILTIHGGLTNFELSAKMERALRRGLMQSAKSCDVWIITTGMHQGVVQHITNAITDLRGVRKTRSKVTSIGIAPWGLVKKRSRLIGKDTTVSYTTNLLSRGRYLELDRAHSHFLLADNGTVGRYGAEVILRRRLESFLSTGSAPVVALVVEGGTFAVKIVHDYLYSNPAIPVVVCEGSGRASELISFTEKCMEDEDELPAPLRVQLHAAVKHTFHLDDAQSERVTRRIEEIGEKRSLLSIYRIGQGRQDVDHAIFAALMKGTNMDQLRLALAWNRVDIAKTHIFGGKMVWSQPDLQDALMYALLHNRVEFAHLILDHGVSMQNFLTFERLEQLYTSDLGPPHTLYNLTRSDKFTIPLLGAKIEKLMGRSFRSHYTSEEFITKYHLWQNRAQYKSTTAKSSPGRKSQRGSENMSVNEQYARQRSYWYQNAVFEEDEDDPNTTEMLFTFDRPFHELLVWAVLTKRQEMAIAMWKHGDEPLAKAMIANRLYLALTKNASDTYLEMTLCDELSGYARKFQELAAELLEACYVADDAMTKSLLTYEMANWGRLTALSLASVNHDRMFMKHPSCQSILNEIWHGGMVVKHSADWGVLASIVCPPLLLALDYKTKEELKKQPQTTAEFEENVESESEAPDSDVDFSYSDYDSSSSDEEKFPSGTRNTRSASIFANVRRSFRRKEEDRPPQTIQQLAAHTLPGLFPGAPTSPGATSTTSRVRSGTVQMKTRARREESTSASRSRKASRSSVKSSSGQQTLDSFSDMAAEDDRRMALRKKTPISWTRKIYEFYSAPITTLYMWEIGFAIFQIILAFCLLVRTDPDYIHPEEYYLIAYVVVFGCDLLRRFIVYDVHPFTLKVYNFVVSFRNGSSLLAVLIYIIGFGFRCSPDYVQQGRVIIIAGSVLWSLKMIEYLSVYRLIGPFIYSCSQMIPTCIPMMVLLFVILVSFGTVRQAIMYPDEDWNIILVRNIFYKPYYMLYGEVYADEIDQCNDAMWDYHLDQGIPMYAINETDPDWNCVPGHWVAPFYMTFFMIISFVLLINSMIAACTWVYEHCILFTKETYLLERYRIVMDYESRPFLPPPFCIINHAYRIGKYIIRRCTGKGKGGRFMDSTMKSFLTSQQLYDLGRFECQTLENVERKKEHAKKHSNEGHIAYSCTKTEQILHQLNSTEAVKESVRDLIQELDKRMTRLEIEREEHLHALSSISAHLASLSASRATAGAPPSYEEYTRSNIPQVFVESASDEEGNESNRMRRRKRTSSSRSDDGEVTTARSDVNRPSRQRRRSNSEYTTIADAIERPETPARQVSLFTRRRRISSGEPNPNLFSVSEADEECDHSDHH